MGNKARLLAVVLVAAVKTASAQSSVTINGTLDMSVARINNTTGAATVNLNQMRTDGYLPSKLVFKGTEDLGGGLRAGFFLDAGLNPDTGTTNSKFFNRRSTLSLTGDWGEIRLGRDYVPTFWNNGTFDPFINGGIAAIYNTVTTLGSGATTLFRSDNALGYFLPANLGGIYGQAMVSAGEDVVGNSYRGARLGYQGGPLNAAVAYGETTGNVGGPKFKTGNVGGSYSLGYATLMGIVSQQMYGPLKQRNYLIGGSVPLGAWEVKAAYTKVDAYGAGTNANDASQLALGFAYNLSKNTNLYGTYSRIANRAGASFIIAQTGGSALGGHSQGAEFGMRTSF
jgi:predicted porin